MELTERITSRVTELTGEVELLRKQLADAERELARLEIAGQVITQLTADDMAAASEEAAGSGPSGQRGFGLLVPPRGQASGPGGLPGDYRSLLEAVSAVAAETGRSVTCGQAAQRGRPRPGRPPGGERPRETQAARRPRLAAPHRGRDVHHRTLTRRLQGSCLRGCPGGRIGV